MGITSITAQAGIVTNNPPFSLSNSTMLCVTHRAKGRQVGLSEPDFGAAIWPHNFRPTMKCQAPVLGESIAASSRRISSRRDRPD